MPVVRDDELQPERRALRVLRELQRLHREQTRALSRRRPPSTTRSHTAALTSHTRLAQPDASTKPDWPHWAKGYLEARKNYPDLHSAAEAAGVHRTTVWRLTQRDPEFAEADRAVHDEHLDRLERIIYSRATAGTPVKKTVTRTTADGSVETTVTEERHISDTLAMFYLKRWRPEYREAYRVEASGPGGGPVQIEAGPRERSVERIEGLLRLALELGVAPVVEGRLANGLLLETGDGSNGDAPKE